MEKQEKQEASLGELQKTNFNLKMKIFYLEKRLNAQGDLNLEQPFFEESENEKVMQLENKIHELKTHIKNRDQQIFEKNNLLNEAKDAIKDLEETIQKVAASKNRSEIEDKKLEEELQDMNKHIKEKDKTIKVIQEEKNLLQKEIEKYKEKIKMKNALVQQKDETINEVKNQAKNNLMHLEDISSKKIEVRDVQIKQWNSFFQTCLKSLTKDRPGEKQLFDTFPKEFLFLFPSVIKFMENLAQMFDQIKSQLKEKLISIQSFQILRKFENKIFKLQLKEKSLRKGVMFLNNKIETKLFQSLKKLEPKILDENRLTGSRTFELRLKSLETRLAQNHEAFRKKISSKNRTIKKLEKQIESLSLTKTSSKSNSFNLEPLTQQENLSSIVIAAASLLKQSEIVLHKFKSIKTFQEHNSHCKRLLEKNHLLSLRLNDLGKNMLTLHEKICTRLPFGLSTEKSSLHELDVSNFSSKRNSKNTVKEEKKQLSLFDQSLEKLHSELLHNIDSIQNS
eukprot:snap_masked-scaffold_17-processed-gene-6.54-mRNA-1 protein AED:1.00 eAED:1.00 QI:0/0/0/0/1/1/3/0/507